MARYQPFQQYNFGYQPKVWRKKEQDGDTVREVPNQAAPRAQETAKATQTETQALHSLSIEEKIIRIGLMFESSLQSEAEKSKTTFNLIFEILTDMKERMDKQETTIKELSGQLAKTKAEQAKTNPAYTINGANGIFLHKIDTRGNMAPCSEVVSVPSGDSNGHTRVEACGTNKDVRFDSPTQIGQEAIERLQTFIDGGKVEPALPSKAEFHAIMTPDFYDEWQPGWQPGCASTDIPDYAIETQEGHLFRAMPTQPVERTERGCVPMTRPQGHRIPSQHGTAPKFSLLAPSTYRHLCVSDCRDVLMCVMAAA